MAALGRWLAVDGCLFFFLCVGESLHAHRCQSYQQFEMAVCAAAMVWLCWAVEGKAAHRLTGEIS